MKMEHSAPKRRLLNTIRRWTTKKITHEILHVLLQKNIVFLLRNYGYRIFTGGKAAGTWYWPPTPSSAEVTEG
jgi:hypothetical protein